MAVPATLPVNKFGGPSLRVGNIVSAALTGNLTLSVDGSEYIGFDSDGAHTVTLPAAAECAGQIRQIANIGAANTVAVAGGVGGTVTLTNYATAKLAGAAASAWSITYGCDGSQWIPLSWSTRAA